MLGIDDLDVMHRLDVSGSDRAFALFLQRQHNFVAVVQLQHDALKVQQDVNHILLNSLDGRVLVQYARNLHLRRGKTGHGGKQHPTQSVAKCVSVSALERLHHHFRMGCGDALHVDDTRFQKSAGLHEKSLCSNALLRIQLNYQSLVNRGRQF